jgi:hypothetical protein
MNETVLRKSGMKCLIDKFGIVDAERFISLMIKEDFDYTEWQKNLFNDLSVEDIFTRARAAQN